MALVFDATLSGAASNSYITVEQANSYMEGRYENTLWPTTTTDIQRLLVSATRRIDSERFDGLKTTTTQRLQWPRQAIFDRDGFTYSSTALPQNLINAICEYAYWLLQQDERIMSEVELHDAAMMTSNNIGPISQSYGRIEANKLPANVVKELEAIGPGAWKQKSQATKLYR